MSEYNFNAIEQKWQDYWKENQTFKTSDISDKPKFYVLDMFPYPSGAGLHVGHPLGYIASDIVTRYKRLQGHDVLHPMGFDSFGLPAEQYAVQTGQHPKVTTDVNIKRYKEQLANIGFSYDWDREVRTSDPSYYKWTQWIFIQLFNSWYNKEADKAESIDTLLEKFNASGTSSVNASCEENTPSFSADEWKALSEKEQQLRLLDYRLAFISETLVNWCPELGTVLANDEVKEGLSERGGHPVERKSMRQWSLRITAYADRLLNGLDNVNWSDSLTEMQRNWVGKSIGCKLSFKVENQELNLDVFTTRADTTFGVTYVSIAPEHELVNTLTTPEQKAAVDEYVTVSKNRSERDRMSDVKTVSGVFTGSYAINPFNGKQVPIWVADYVLAGYGTGIVMAVPSSDERDYKFATHFGLEIINVQEGGKSDITQDNFDAKSGTMINSDFLNGLKVPEAITKAIAFAEEKGFGESKVNFRLRDAVFSRQRYWGEPIPIYFNDGVPYPIEESELPLILPEIDDFKPTETGEPPLGRAKDWKYKDKFQYELSTMPGWAGSSWYFFRYMNPKNEDAFIDKDIQEYWKDVDLYLGGAEHATGHLLYSRFWNKFLYDLGYVNTDEVFQKLVNQGMIQGRSSFVYRLSYKASGTFGEDVKVRSKINPILPSKGVYNRLVKNELTKEDAQAIDKAKKEVISQTDLKIEFFNQAAPLHADVSFVSNDILNIDQFKSWREQFKDAEFILEDGKYICGTEVEKMSKSKYNVVNPDKIIERYGADTLRMYEMFLGPLEQSKPWSTNGIDGVYKFLKKLWRLFYDLDGNLKITEAKPSKEEQKVIHGTIKKIKADIEGLSLNTSVSNFMICVNELSTLKSSNKEVLGKLLTILSPYAPHICEELWSSLGNKESITFASFPECDESFLIEADHDYPIMINGRMRTKISFALDMPKDQIEKEVLANEIVQKWLEGKTPKKLIVVPKKIVNVVM